MKKRWIWTSARLSRKKEKAYEEIQKAKEVIGDYPIAVIIRRFFVPTVWLS